MQYPEGSADPFQPSLEEIQEAYEEGDLDAVEEDLFSFLKNRRQEIHETRRDLEEKFPQKDINLTVATKTYIMQIRSINPEYEIQKEMEDIKREVKRQESLQDRDVERDEIVREWCDRYAPSWRDRHVMTIIYVFEQNKQRYLSVLKNGSSA
jgi:hypothetical protein